MGIRDRRHLLPRRRQAGRACPSARWSSIWTLKCSTMSIALGGRGVALPSNSSGDVPPSSPFGKKGGGMHDLPRPLTWPPVFWTHRWTCLPSRQWGPGWVGKKSGTCTTKYTNSEDYQGPHQCEPEWTEELARDMVSSLKEHLRLESGASHQGDLESPNQQMPGHLQSKTPRRRRSDTSTERDLAEAREAHWRVLGCHSHIGG